MSARLIRIECDNCGYNAAKRLIDSDEEPIGVFCRVCAEPALHRERLREEVETARYYADRGELA